MWNYVSWEVSFTSDFSKIKNDSTTKLSNNKDWFVLAQLRQLMRKKSHVKSYEVMKSHEVMKSYEVRAFHSRRNWNVDSMQKPERECCWKCWLSPGLAISLTHFQDTGLQEMQVWKIKQRILLWFMLLYIYNQNLLYFMQDLSAVYFIFLRTDLVELRQIIQESVTLSILKHAVNFFMHCY